MFWGIEERSEKRVRIASEISIHKERRKIKTWSFAAVLKFYVDSCLKEEYDTNIAESVLENQGFDR